MKPPKTNRPAQVNLALIALFVVLASTGCDAVLTTTRLPPVREDRILGDWKDMGVRGSKPDPEPVSIRFANDEYWLGSATKFAEGEATAFSLSRLGNTLITQYSAKDQRVEFGTEKGQPCWSLNRLEVLSGQLNWYEFLTEGLARDAIHSSTDHHG